MIETSTRAGVVGPVGKISAFRTQGPQFDPGSAEIWTFVWPSFAPNSALHPSGVGKWVPAFAGS